MRRGGAAQAKRGGALSRGPVTRNQKSIVRPRRPIKSLSLYGKGETDAVGGLLEGRGKCLRRLKRDPGEGRATSNCVERREFFILRSYKVVKQRRGHVLRPSRGYCRAGTTHTRLSLKAFRWAGVPGDEDDLPLGGELREGTK